MLAKSRDGELMMMRVLEVVRIMEVFVRRDGLWRILDRVENTPFGFKHGSPTTEIENGKIIVYDVPVWEPRWTIVLFDSYGSNRELPRD
jgi:alpha-D-ribose 1-methylphosphonate 5-phosphate C-P lyase